MTTQIYAISNSNNRANINLHGDMKVTLTSVSVQNFIIRFFTSTFETFSFTSTDPVYSLEGTVSNAFTFGGKPGMFLEFMYDLTHARWYIVGSNIASAPNKLIAKYSWEGVTLPTVTLKSNTSSVTTPGSITLTATVVDANPITKVEFYKGITLIGTSTTSPYTNNISYTYADNGTNTYSAKLYDNVGNVITSGNVSVTVNIPVPDTTPPTVSISASQNTVASSSTQVTLTVTASDTQTGVSKVELYKNGVLLNSKTTSPYTFTQSYTTTDNGSISYTAKAYDGANNSATSTATVVTVNIPAPTVITGLTLASDIKQAFQTAMANAAQGSKRTAGANAIITNMQPSHSLVLYKDGTSVATVTYDGDAQIQDNGTDIGVTMGNILTSSASQAADINTGTWTFAIIGGNPSAVKIQGTVGPTGSGANLELQGSLTQGQFVDPQLVLIIPRSVDGLS